MAPRHPVDERVGGNVGQGAGIGTDLAAVADATAGADRCMQTQEHIRTNPGKATERGVGGKHTKVANRRIVRYRRVVIDEHPAAERGSVTDNPMRTDDRSLSHHRRRHHDGGGMDEREESPPAGDKHLGQPASDPRDAYPEQETVPGNGLIGVRVAEHRPSQSSARRIAVQKAGKQSVLRRPGIPQPAADLAAKSTTPNNQDAATVGKRQESATGQRHGAPRRETRTMQREESIHHPSRRRRRTSRRAATIDGERLARHERRAGTREKVDRPDDVGGVSQPPQGRPANDPFPIGR